MTVAIVTDSGSDMSPDQLRDQGIRQVALTVSIGDRRWLAPDELAPEEFWRLMQTPGTPMAQTAAPSAGQFRQAFEEAFASGADEVVCVCISETLSSTVGSARLGAQMLPDRRIHCVDSRQVSMALGPMAQHAASMAAAGASGAEILERMTALSAQTKWYVALETLEYLRRGGRISPARAAIGGLLSVKPIVTGVDGIVVPADSPRTRARARARMIELFADRPLLELHMLYAPPAEVDSLRDEILARLPGPAPRIVTTNILGPVIGTHVGPGAYGAAMIYLT